MPLPYQHAAKRSLAVADDFWTARASAVDAAHVQVLCPDTATVAYDGTLLASPAMAYPSPPYAPFQVPCVAASDLTKLTAAGGAALPNTCASATAVSSVQSAAVKPREASIVFTADAGMS